MVFKDFYCHIRTAGVNVNYFSDEDVLGGARGVMVIIVGNEHGDTNSNPG